MEVTTDLETIPAQKPEVLDEITQECRAEANAAADAVQPPSNYKSEETIAKWWAETGHAKRAGILAEADVKADELYRKTALDGAFGQLVVIGYAIDDHDPVAIWFSDYDSPSYESHLLCEFYVALERARKHTSPVKFIGHNIAGFDLRFLWQRSVINGIQPPAFIPFNAKPWDSDRLFDNMIAWAGVGRTISQDKLSRALGQPGKPDGIDGSKVWDFVKGGRIEEVATYCIDDVTQARANYRKLQFVSVAA